MWFICRAGRGLTSSVTRVVPGEGSEVLSCVVAEVVAVAVGHAGKQAGAHAGVVRMRLPERVSGLVDEQAEQRAARPGVGVIPVPDIGVVKTGGCAGRGWKIVVAAEGFAIDEAVLAIERERRFKRWARSGFEA